MKLYAVSRSPFATRVLAAARFKGVDLTPVPPPPGGLTGPAYLALNPIGKLPTLELADGATIPESAVIIDYLEAVRPERSLTPVEPQVRVRARLVDRVAELYVLGPLFGLFPQLAPATRDAAVVERLFGEMRRGLEHLERWLEPGPYAVSAEPTLADCIVAPAGFWVDEISRMFARPNPRDGLPKLAAYLAFARDEAVLGPLLSEMAQDLARLRGG